MKTDDAIVRARELLAALDKQLTASDAEGEEARKRVAALSFGLTALLEQLGTHAADNDQGATARAARPVVQLHEEFPDGRDRRFIVARFAARWFVLTGYTAAPLSTYGVLGPYDHALHARSDAVRLHNEATGTVLWAMQRVVEA